MHRHQPDLSDFLTEDVYLHIEDDDGSDETREFHMTTHEIKKSIVSDASIWEDAKTIYIPSSAFEESHVVSGLGFSQLLGFSVEESEKIDEEPVDELDVNFGTTLAEQKAEDALIVPTVKEPDNTLNDDNLITLSTANHDGDLSPSSDQLAEAANVQKIRVENRDPKPTENFQSVQKKNPKKIVVEVDIHAPPSSNSLPRKAVPNSSSFSTSTTRKRKTRGFGHHTPFAKKLTSSSAASTSVDASKINSKVSSTTKTSSTITKTEVVQNDVCESDESKITTTTTTTTNIEEDIPKKNNSPIETMGLLAALQSSAVQVTAKSICTQADAYMYFVQLAHPYKGLNSLWVQDVILKKTHEALIIDFENTTNTAAKFVFYKVQETNPDIPENVKKSATTVVKIVKKFGDKFYLVKLKNKRSIWMIEQDLRKIYPALLNKFTNESKKK